MEKTEMLKLLSYEDNKILLDGYDLVEIANMYNLSVVNFLELFRYYLKENQALLESGYYIGHTEATMLEDPSQLSTLKTTGEILVPANGYEAMKKQIFDFAYTKCSNLGDSSFGCWGLSSVEAWTTRFSYQISERNPKNYSCFYTSSKGGWNQKISNIAIDKEDQEKRYSLLQK